MRVLATDLDGTFLGGSATARERLTRFFRDHPERSLLYVTGRSARSVTQLVADGVLPQPDAMICDVGSYVAHADGSPYEGPLLDDIRTRWGDRSAAVQAALSTVAGLRLQEAYGPHRVSYYFDAPEMLPLALEIAEALGCDGLVSDNMYFDVLPKGVNKGSTLTRFLRERGVRPADVLVAGDTLNDLAMLASGLPAVVVGNAEPALLDRLPPSARILRATQHGSDGIVEALHSLKVDLHA